jgi:hypothetical protein
LVIVISVTGLSVVFLSSGTMAAPYGTALGQAVLAVVAAIYAAGLLWLRRLAVLTTGTRLLHTTGTPPVVRPANREEARTS